ncbi:MJ0042-type zinc finger domain-containing protein [Nitrobacter vulgaris]|uniref:Thioredoxin n=1 Tax=Nitrobacter vulgaris TaxID=29421 RepID=A0A1V4I2H9_NITVU|nr:MJ0042-type zinc finger domain-containing protein [Nitrobacter vulgaris]OPH84050.1 thioredoxin [Nitrobacter vulgaris]
MHIVCPHCTTSYAVDLASFGGTGRTVRCSRCKKTWRATPDNIANVRIPTMAGADEMAGWTDPPKTGDMPSVDSPSIASDLPKSPELGGPPQDLAGVWTSPARQDNTPHDNTARDDKRPLSIASRFRDRLKPLFALRPPAITLNTFCVAMAAMVLALVIWRVEIVHLLPQTATFYRLVGLEVNLRGLAFKDVKTSTETVDGKPVLVIEGMIVAQSRKPVELPRLRFSVRDAHETEIYAWNAVLEQAALKPGENVWFRTRLAAPPSEGRRIGVRFFNRQDLAAGNGA